MDLIASAVMNKDVTTMNVDASLAELESLFVKLGVSGFPVVDNSGVVGIVSKTDLIEALHPRYDVRAKEEKPHTALPVAEPLNTLTVREIMTSNVVSVAPNAHLHEVADLMYQKRLHRIVVVDNGSLVGIITPFDFVRLYSHDRIGTDGRPCSTLDF